MNWLLKFIAWLVGERDQAPAQTPPQPPVRPVAAVEPPNPPSMPTDQITATESDVLDWTTPKGAFHATRVTADNLGLTIMQKDTLCACIYQESRFDNEAVCFNKDKTGNVWSRDIGIVQINTYFHIGKGKEFASEAYVLSHPAECVAWMAGFLKRTGKLQPWSSYSTGAYPKWLVPTSPMWALRT